MVGENIAAVSPIQRVAVATLMGTTLEWYDYFIYGSLAALAFNRLFFPTLDPLVGSLAAFVSFAAGFVLRPVGGSVAGRYGDQIGRKTLLILTLMTMGIATFVIGLLPTYATIGVWPPLLLLTMRLIQGLGLGGEWGGAVLIAVEHAPERRRGFYGSLPQIGVPLALVLSATVIFVIARLPEEAFLSWGWRVPFLLSILLLGVGMYVRLRIEETPVFQAVKDAPDESSAANISAFTLGSAIGIWLGGWAIDAGLGIASVNLVGGLISLSGLALAVIAWAFVDERYPDPLGGEEIPEEAFGHRH